MKTLMIAVAITASVLTAGAADFTKPLLDLDGKTVHHDGKTDTPAVTLADVATNALLATFPDEPNLAWADKLKRFQIAEKIKTAKGADLVLPRDEAELLHKLIAKMYGPVVVGRAYQAIENVVPPK